MNVFKNMLTVEILSRHTVCCLDIMLHTEDLHVED